MTFHIGQQVMCIRRLRQTFGSITYPKFMQIYTVRAYCPVWKRFPAILLSEIVNRDCVFVSGGIGEPCWGERCFAPLADLSGEERTTIRTSLPRAKWRELNRQ